MDFRADKVDGSVARLDALIMALLPAVSGPALQTVERWRSDAAALHFHLRRRPGAAPLVTVILGGTGTGKSTIVNRILGQNISATSFRRTYTSGPVAIAASAAQVPPEWLGVEHIEMAPADLPARGRTGSLLIAILGKDLTCQLTLVDTPDLDGDQPTHHAEADRAFRWADAILFLVTPEKYQMTELMPYYRLAGRYQVPALFVLNKCEQQAVVEDYARLLKVQASAGAAAAGMAPGEQSIFVVPRDDAGYEPPAEQNLIALQHELLKLSPPSPAARAAGLGCRVQDLLGRLDDQIVAPLRQDRQDVNALIAALRGLESPVPGVDVNPLTQQLQRRMQQRSVLYLMGPQRILERVRQAPGLLVRLPRVAWDYVMRGDISAAALSPTDTSDPRKVPDFQSILTDQFAVLQSRLDDTLRSSDVMRRRMPEGAAPPYQSAMMDSGEAGRIADEELAALKAWLERRWNSTPRDTRIIESLLKFLPGGKQITKWTEAAPYLLVLVVATATHHLFGGVDLVVLGGWSLATWLTERLSNEVAAHTRQTNQRITDRFTRLAHEQIERMCKWLDGQAPAHKALDELEHELEEARELIEGGD
jgi:hypothetical protein